PWAFGGGDSHPPRATHANIRTPRRSTRVSTTSFSADGDAPLPIAMQFHGFGHGLEPRWIVGAAAHSTSELLRTLSRMAASKPTSWLFPHRDYLAHLARSWGP